MKQRALVIALVVGLHLAAIWLLWSTQLRITAGAARENLLLLLLMPASPPSELAASRAARAARVRPERRPLEAEPGANPPSVPEPDAAIQPPIDWAGELERAAKDAALADAAPQPREFGFPRPAAPSAPKAPEFAWSHAHTHRIEMLPDGGMLINLNDRCVIVFTPFPFPFCGLGKKPANSHLFDHLHDPP